MGAKLTVPTILDLGDAADGYLLDVAGGEAYLNFFSATGVISRNLVEGGAVPLVTGTPTVSGELAQFGLARGAWVNTGVSQPTGNFTIIAVAKSVVADRGMIVANWEGTAKGGLLFQFGGAGASLMLQTTITNSGTLSQDAAEATLGVSVGGTYCVAGRYNATTRLKTINNLTTGLSNTRTPAYPMLAEPQNKLLIGKSVSSYSSAVDVGMVLIYDRLLSDVELAAQYAQIKAAFAVRGVTI